MKAEIAGREDEVEILQRQLLLPESSFVAMYGRRRIGKTFLIYQVYQKHLAFECGGLHEKSTVQQLENFNLQLNAFFRANRKQPPPATWLQAFDRLRQYLDWLPQRNRKVIFLDEISWFDVPKSGFKAALGNFWNQYASRRKDVVLVICGSAASWIINKVVNDRGGLHNRITCKIELQPFTLRETAAFLKLKKVALTQPDIIRLYMAAGGVPFYLTHAVNGESPDQVIQKLFFSKNPILKNEFNNLYAALFKNSGDHIAIVKALAQKNKGLTRSEIIKYTKLRSGGGLTQTLQELSACGFITEIRPINKTKEDVLYRLLDEYTIFYFRFIEYQRGYTNWAASARTAAYKTWCGYAFENICIRHTAGIKNALGIAGIVSSEYSWQQKGANGKPGAQADLVIDRDDNCINMCEAKFYATAFETTAQYARQLMYKKAAFTAAAKTRKNVFITLITLSGAVPNKHYNSVVTSQLTAAAFFK
jgi:uncharacterized protein